MCLHSAPTEGRSPPSMTGALMPWVREYPVGGRDDRSLASYQKSPSGAGTARHHIQMRSIGATLSPYPKGYELPYQRGDRKLWKGKNHRCKLNELIPVTGILEAHRLEAYRKAKEALIMSLLEQGDISSGRAARLLSISRLQVLDLMSKYDISPFDDSMTLEEFQAEVALAARKLEQDKQ